MSSICLPRALILGFGLALLGTGCGASPPPSKAPDETTKTRDEPNPVTASTSSESSSSATSSSTSGSATTADDERAPASESAADVTPAAPSDPDPGPDTTRREVKYLVSPDGMRVETAGVVFTPTAEPVRNGNGWGVKVHVGARSLDGKSHSLLAPTGSELAFAGSVTRTKGDPEEFGDKRENDHEIVLEKKAAKLSRVWPAKAGPKPVTAGDELKLAVGIWGVGDDATSRRPLRKLCTVFLKIENGKPRVSVKAPEGVSK